MFYIIYNIYIFLSISAVHRKREFTSSPSVNAPQAELSASGRCKSLLMGALLGGIWRGSGESYR